VICVRRSIVTRCHTKPSCHLSHASEAGGAGSAATSLEPWRWRHPRSLRSRKPSRAGKAAAGREPRRYWTPDMPTSTEQLFWVKECKGSWPLRVGPGDARRDLVPPGSPWRQSVVQSPRRHACHRPVRRPERGPTTPTIRGVRQAFSRPVLHQPWRALGWFLGRFAGRESRCAQSDQPVSGCFTSPRLGRKRHPSVPKLRSPATTERRVSARVDHTDHHPEGPSGRDAVAPER